MLSASRSTSVVDASIDVLMNDDTAVVVVVYADTAVSRMCSGVAINGLRNGGPPANGFREVDSFSFSLEMRSLVLSVGSKALSLGIGFTPLRSAVDASVP